MNDEVSVQWKMTEFNESSSNLYEDFTDLVG